MLVQADRAIRLACLCLATALSWSALGLDYARLRSSLLETYGPQAEQQFDDWRNLINQTAGQSNGTKLKLVNDFFNQHIQFDNDIVVWQKNDYWATPMQTQGRQQGDCEDFAIAKYFTLVAAGIPEQQLRLMYVLAELSGGRQAHMVLAYYGADEDDPLVLDNINKQILPAGARSDLSPVYSLARHDSSSETPAPTNARERMAMAGKQLRRSIWQDLIRRAQLEGFD